MSELKPALMWAFVWMTGQPYITSYVSWRRAECRRDVEKMMGEPWRKVYRRGGRIIRVTVQPAGQSA